MFYIGDKANISKIRLNKSIASSKYTFFDSQSSDCQNLFTLMDGLNEYCPNLKSTSFYYCVETRGLVIMNARLNNLFLIINRVGVAGKDNSSEPTNGEVPTTLTNRDITDKKLPAIEGGNSVQEKPSVIINGNIADEKPLAIGS